MIELEFNAKDLDRMRRAIGATEKIAETSLLNALKLAQRKTAVQIKRQVARELKLPVGAIGARIKFRRPSKGDLYARVWIGLNPVPASRAGKPRGAEPGKPTKGGVRVGKRRYPHAFILHGKRVVRRTTTKQYPLENVTIPIAEKAEKVLARKAWPDAQQILLDEFARQMKFRMEKLARAS